VDLSVNSGASCGPCGRRADAGVASFLAGVEAALGAASSVSASDFADLGIRVCDGCGDLLDAVSLAVEHDGSYSHHAGQCNLRDWWNLHVRRGIQRFPVGNSPGMLGFRWIFRLNLNGIAGESLVAVNAGSCRTRAVTDETDTQSVVCGSDRCGGRSGAGVDCCSGMSWLQNCE
jgi:hypothetical protein